MYLRKHQPPNLQTEQFPVVLEKEVLYIFAIRLKTWVNAKHYLSCFESRLECPLGVPLLLFSRKEALPSHYKLSFHSFGKYVHISAANQKKKQS
jgi:hypothetical protein